jgi:hypothetical protein
MSAAGGERGRIDGFVPKQPAPKADRPRIDVPVVAEGGAEAIFSIVTTGAPLQKRPTLGEEMLMTSVSKGL